jgi:uncharacterized protein YhjY with autotransporter beta-barrel domain
MNFPNRSLTSRWRALLALAALLPVTRAGDRESPPLLDILQTQYLANSGAGAATLSIARTSTSDVGDRLFRLRAGIPWTEESVATTAPDAKGGMAKSPVMPAPAAPRRWEVYGSLFHYAEEQDRQTILVGPSGPGGDIGGILMLHPATDVDIFGGTVGIEHRFTRNWSAGLALTGSRSDVEMTLAGTSEIDTLAVTPYLSYVQADVLGGADFWADLAYSHGFHELDIQRFTLAGGVLSSTDADTDRFDFTSGLNFQSGNVTHGPYGGLRWIDGSVNSYYEGGNFGLYPDQEFESLVSILGYQASFPIQVRGGTLVPQIRGEWEHEFEDEGSRLFGFPLGERDENAVVLGAGIGYHAAAGWNAVFNYEARLSDRIEGHYVSLKVGLEF